MRIEHIAIWCKSLELMRSFYQAYFNAQASDIYINESKGFSSYFLTLNEGARVELMSMNCVPKSANDVYAQFTGFIHIAFALGSEQSVNELTAQLQEDGFEVIDEPRRTGDGYYESVVLDPEGNRLELTI